MDPRMIIFSLAYCTFTLTKYIVADFLPDAMVKEHEIPHIKAGNIVVFYGISHIVGAILSGVTSNYLKNSAVLLISLCMVILGFCCVGMAYSVLYWQFVLCCFIYGLFQHCVVVLLPISLIDMFGIESLKSSYSMIMFCSAIATLFGPPIAGTLKVLWGSYDFAFNITGGFYFLGAILTFIVLWMPKRKNSSTLLSEKTVPNKKSFRTRSEKGRR